MKEKIVWRKDEKRIYPTQKKPVITTLPPQQFITISGHGNPNKPEFGAHISALYPISYAIKMAPKKGINFPNAYDYTVYPLEGFWTLPDNYQKKELDKNDLIYKIMIKQPNFVNQVVFEQALKLAAPKTDPVLLQQLRLETIDEGLVGMILHVGSFDDEPTSFKQLEEFVTEAGYLRSSKAHKEIYLSDFRRVSEEKRKTILRVSLTPTELR